MVHPARELARVGDDRDVAQYLRLARETVVLPLPAKFFLVDQSARRQRTVVIDLHAAGAAQPSPAAVEEVVGKGIEVNLILQGYLAEIGTPRHLDGQTLLDECNQRHALATSFAVVVGKMVYALTGQIQRRPGRNYGTNGRLVLSPSRLNHLRQDARVSCAKRAHGENAR